MNARILRPSSSALFSTSRCLTSTIAPLPKTPSSQIRPVQQSFARGRRFFQTSSPFQFKSSGKRMAVHEINSKSDFDKVISEQVSPQGVDHKGQVIFIDAFATWCGPCKAVAPIISRWSEDPQEGLKDKVTFYKFDVDKVPELAQELGVRAMPTFFIFKGGESTPAEQVVGASPPLMKKGIEKVLGMQ